TVRQTAALGSTCSALPRSCSAFGRSPCVWRASWSEGPGSAIMSTAMNFGSKSFQPRAPDKGSFPLDHFGECKSFKEKFMKCLRDKNFENALCRNESKEYLECRMERQATDGTRTTGKTGIWRFDRWKVRYKKINFDGKKTTGLRWGRPEQHLHCSPAERAYWAA
ncbi:Cytochrome c oxidase assembly protein COX19, partial [Galemys pyrenaicus]